MQEFIRTAQAHESSLHAYNDPDLSPIEFLTAVMRDTHLPMASRIEAARALLPYTEPRPANSFPPRCTIIIPPFEPRTPDPSPAADPTGNPRLPTLEEVMNGSPFDIVDSPWGHIERWRASTLATGTMGVLANVYDIVRSDAAEATARADADKAREALIQDLCSRIDSYEHRFDALQKRLTEAEAERTRDDAARRKFDAEPINLPPGSNEPEPTPLRRDRGAHIREDEPPEPLVSKEPEPSLELVAEPDDASSRQGSDALGDLPEELRDLPDPTPEPQGKVYPQPVSISLNKE